MMSIFSIFNRQKKEPDNITPAATIRVILGNIPEYYKESKDFQKCMAHFELNEWGPAIECLVAMADESGHYFSDDFWFGLADAAGKMNMNTMAQYCREQSRKTKSILNWPISKGSTVHKIDDTHYKQYYAQKVYDRWDNERRIKDKLQSFIDKDGFHIQKGGRHGTIYYISNGKVCEIYWEMSGVPQYDILISFDLVDSWALPVKQLLTEKEQQQIKTALILWLNEQNIRSDINPKQVG